MACCGSVALSLASSVASMACWGRTRVAHGRAKQGRTPQANSGGVARGEARLRRRVRRRDLRRERRHRLAGLAAREGLVRGPPRLQRVEDVRLQRVPRRVRVGPRAAHEHRDAMGAGRRAGREGGEQHSHVVRRRDTTFRQAERGKQRAKARAARSSHSLDCYAAPPPIYNALLLGWCAGRGS